MTSKKTTPISSGTLITISSGAYSDYTVHGVFSVLVGIDPDIELEEYLNAHPDQRGAYRFNEDAFVAYLVKREVLEEVPSPEWHIGNYCNPYDGWWVI